MKCVAMRKVTTMNQRNSDDDDDNQALLEQADDNVDKGIVREGFPLVLLAMLDETDAKDLSPIVSWQPHGRCFMVHKRKSFVEKVIPRYFRMSKFASFQRQLNLYGFRRITRGIDKDDYYHFVQNRRDICWKVLRVQKKERQHKRIPETREPEPNFYSAEYAIGANADLKMPPTEPTNLMPSNFYSSPPMSMGLSATPPSFYPSFFATAQSTVNPGSSFGPLQQQYFFMNHPTLLRTSPSAAHDHLLYQQQMVMNNLMASSSGQQGMNATSALANLDMDAWASALQGLGGTMLQQPQPHGLSMSTMFPSATVSQQHSSMLPPQSILQQLSTMALLASKPASFPRCGGPATAPDPGRFHSIRHNDADTEEVPISSKASISELLPSGLSSHFVSPHSEPTTANQSFDAYLAALQFENGDIANITEDDETPANCSREPSYNEAQQENE